MSTKERLRRLVDGLPESEIETAARVLAALHAAADPVGWSLANAREDDEPDDDDADGGLTEARADMAAGRVIPLDEVKRDLGV